MNTQTTTTIPTGTSDDPIRLDSSPEKTLETPKTPVSIKPRSRRNPGPPKFYGNKRFIDQVTLGTETISVVDSDDEPLITLSSSKSPRTQTVYSTASPSDYLTPVEDIPWPQHWWRKPHKAPPQHPLHEQQRSRVYHLHW